jgi:L-fuculokinase
MPSLINYLLTGEKVNDISMAGTSMLTDLKTFSLSDTILTKIGCDRGIFGEIGQAGDAIGNVTPVASGQTGIPSGTLVCLTGHDTQFAIYGSGAEISQPVVSSGTWEILMTRSADFSTSEVQLKTGITTEFDASKGLYNIGLNWLGSGIVEWVRNRFYPDCSQENCYDIMVNEAMQVEPGSNGVFINPDFKNIGNTELKGQIMGLTLNTTRGEIMRATFEALSFQTKVALNALENAGNFKAEKIICVGGGSKNKLWNQIRADVLNLPVETIQQKETTVLGASFFAFTAAGIFPNPEQAKANIKYAPQLTYPSENTYKYLKIYSQWLKLNNLK